MTDEELRAKLAASLSEVVADWLTESVQRLRRRLDALVSGMPPVAEKPVAPLPRRKAPTTPGGVIELCQAVLVGVMYKEPPDGSRWRADVELLANWVLATPFVDLIAPGDRRVSPVAEKPVATPLRVETARMAIGPDAQPTAPGLPAHEPGCACGECFAL